VHPWFHKLQKHEGFIWREENVDSPSTHFASGRPPWIGIELFGHQIVEVMFEQNPGRSLCRCRLDHWIFGWLGQQIHVLLSSQHSEQSHYSNRGRAWQWQRTQTHTGFEATRSPLKISKTVCAASCTSNVPLGDWSRIVCPIQPTSLKIRCHIVWVKICTRGRAFDCRSDLQEIEINEFVSPLFDEPCFWWEGWVELEIRQW